MTEKRKVKGMSLPIHSRLHATKRNNQSVKQLNQSYKQAAVLFTLFISLLSMSSWAAGTVDTAEITPVTATVLPNSNQSFAFTAQNTKAEILASYTINLAYSTGLDVSNLVISPAAKSAKIDARKQVIAIQWNNVAIGAIVGASWDASSATDGSYIFSDGGISYQIGRTNYTGTVNSATLTVTTDTTPPAIPAGLSATASEVKINLSWTVNSDIDLLGYHVHRASVIGGPYTKLTTTALLSTSYSDNTASDTPFYYVISAVDTAGNNSTYSTEVSATPFNTIAPDIPAGLIAVSGDALVTLNWTANSDIDLLGYDIYRAANAGGPYIKLTTPSLSGTSYTDEAVVNGTSYYYVVTAKDTAENVSGYSVEVNATPLDSTAPQISSVQTTDIINDSVTILWSTNEAASSQVEYGTSNTYGQTSLLNNTSTINHSVTLTGLSVGTLYHYRVLSQDSANNIATSLDSTFVAGQNLAPVADLGGPYSGKPGEILTFDGSASFDPEGENLTYQWNFGDGSTATEVSPTHAYVNDGSYTVTLTVNDGVQNSLPSTTTVNVDQRRVIKISGEIRQTTFKANNLYLVTGDVIVPGSLTIEPGVEIRFPRGRLDSTQYFSFTVNGSLTAIGTARQPIRFTSNQGQGCSKQDWFGIKNGASNTIITVKHAVIECAFRGFWLYNSSGSASITNSLIQNNYRGIFPTFNNRSSLRTRTKIEGNTIVGNTTGILVYGLSSPVITNNTITGNQVAILLQGVLGGNADPKPLIQGNIIVNTNTAVWTVDYTNSDIIIDAKGNWWGSTELIVMRNVIKDHLDNPSQPYVNYANFRGSINGPPVEGNFLYAIVTDMELLPNTSYTALDRLTVSAGATLTINPGTNIRFTEKENLKVMGSLIVQGTSSNPARFSNGSNVRSKNSWDGIQITDNTILASIDYAVITDAGNGILISKATNSGGSVTVSNSSIQGNVTGISISGDTQPIIGPGNIIKSNSIGLSVRGTRNTSQSGLEPNPLVNNNSIYNNSNYNYRAYEFLNAETIQLDATNNWWGSIDTTVIEQGIFDAIDAPISSPSVNYNPYLSASLIDERVPAPVLNAVPAVVGFNPLPLTGTASASSTVDIYVNGVLSTSIIASASGSFNTDIALSEGLNNIYATATLILEKSDASNTLAITLDTVSPTIDISLVSVSDVVSGQTSVIGIAGATEGNTIVKVVNSRNGASASSNANADGSFSFTLAASPADSLVIYSIDEIGNQSPARVLIVPGTAPPLTLAITAPATGSTITTETIVVSGTLTAPSNSGVTVNGVVAQIIGDKFYAKDVLLQAGDNIITATVNTVDGQTTSNSITVTYTPTTVIDLVTLSASPDTGIAALDVTFSVTTDSSITMSQIDLDVDGDDIADITTTDFTVPLTYTYTTPGAYTAKVIVLDSLGNTHTATTTVIVQAITTLRNKLEAVYYTMLERLREGNIGGAMLSLNGVMRYKYQTAFTNSATLQTVIPKLGTIEGGSITGDTAEFIIVRQENGQPIAFKIYLVRDGDGIWRIAEM